MFNIKQGATNMTKQEKIQFIEECLAIIYNDLYPKWSVLCQSGYNRNRMRVYTKDLEEALELIEMWNLECTYKWNPYYPSCTDITICIEKKEEEQPLWGYETK
jgi:hypothetical protein